MSKRLLNLESSVGCQQSDAYRKIVHGADIGSSWEPYPIGPADLQADMINLAIGKVADSLHPICILLAEFDSDERLRKLHPKLVAWKKAFLKIDNPVVQANRHLFFQIAKDTLPVRTAIKPAKKDSFYKEATSNQKQTRIAKTLAMATKAMLDALKEVQAEGAILSELEAVGFREYCKANNLDQGAQSDLFPQWFGAAPVENTFDTVNTALQLLQPVVTEYAKERSAQRGVRSGLTGISFSLCVTLADIGIRPTRSKNGVLCQLLKVWLAYWGLADSSEERAARNGLARYHKLLGQRELT